MIDQKQAHHVRDLERLCEAVLNQWRPATPHHVAPTTAPVIRFDLLCITRRLNVALTAIDQKSADFDRPDFR